MAFNPDEYIASKTNKAQTGFDPDAYIASKKPQSSEPEKPEFFGSSVVEPVATIASALGSTVAGGLAGTAQALNPFADEGAGGRTAEAIQQAGTFIPRTEAGRAGLKAVGDVVQGAIDIANYPVSGIGGLLEAISGQGIEQAIETMQSIRDKGTSKTFGQRVFEETDSPAAGAIAETAPEALLNAVGLGLGSKAGAGVRAAEIAKNSKAQAALTEIENALKTGKATEEGAEKVAEVLKTGTPEEVASIVKADPDFYLAADELGINTEPLAGFASKNPQFRDVEAALRKVPGSVLEPQAINFIEDTSKAADRLIEQYGGSIDKAQLGLDFKNSSLKNIDDLADQADMVYGMVREIIPQGARFEAPDTVAFLNDLKEKGTLTPELSKMLKDLSPVEKTTKGKRMMNPATGKITDTGTTETILPTYAKIDQLRKEVYQGKRKLSGPFKNVETGLNKKIYSLLIKDQDVIAKATQGGAEITDIGKGLVKQRKQLEDNLTTLLGKDLNKALNVTVAGAIKGLEKGQIDQFNAVINAIPKAQRQEVVLSAMNDVFKGSGVNQTALSPTGFTKWYKTINRSPATKKAIFGALPKESRRAIDNLFKVSEGISRSLGQTTPTGRIATMFDNETGFIRKMVGRAAIPAVGFATGSPVASAATNAIMSFMRQSTDGAKAAANLMAAPEFQNIIRNSVRDGVVDGGVITKELLNAQARLEKTKKYQKWAETLTGKDRDKLASGLIGYLFTDKEGRHGEQP